MGYIYLINESGTDKYKIGLTKNKANKRKLQLQTGNSNELNIIRTFETEHQFKLEKMLHMNYANKRCIGEWFVLDANDVFDFIPMCEKLTKTIVFLLENNTFFK